MKRHVFFDLESLGPPGVGQIFALGAVKFEMQGEENRILDRLQLLIAVPEKVVVSAYVLRWLVSQDYFVGAQLAGAMSFIEAWDNFVVWLRRGERVSTKLVFWADDYSDFAHLEVACREARGVSLRNLGAQLDA